MPAKKKVVEDTNTAVVIETKEVKKVTKKATKKSTKVAGKEEKKTVKKTKKATKAVKVEQYNKFALNTCFEMAKAMGVTMEYHDYTQVLLDDTDVKKIAKSIIKKYGIAKKFSFDEDGYDEDLIQVILERVLPTMEVNASHLSTVGQQLKEITDYKSGVDFTEDNEQYKKDFEIIKHTLMLAQRKKITTLKGLKKETGFDVEDAFVAFVDLANTVLKNWTIDDVKYYEGFVYSILSQVKDLYDKYEEKIIMDVSDLYLLKGDLAKGKTDYEYVIRETSDKGHAYLRYVTIYSQIDAEVAKQIAEASKRYVKEDSKYFDDIQKIVK